MKVTQILRRMFPTASTRSLHAIAELHAINEANEKRLDYQSQRILHLERLLVNHVGDRSIHRHDGGEE